MPTNISSYNIEIFPCTTRDIQFQRNARLFSEYNTSNLINQLLTKDGFIITKQDDLASSYLFEFNIHGYNFRIFNSANEEQSGFQYLTELFNNATEIYAYITLDDNLRGYQEITGSDYIENPSISQYSGLNLTTNISEIPNDEYTYSLKIAEKQSSTNIWTTPIESYTIINNYNVDITLIDGGTI